MADTTPLSPAAQAVLDAAFGRWIEIDDGIPGKIAAVALRAAVDQVVPEPNGLDKEMFSISALRVRWVIRDKFLAIAAELEAGQ